MRPFMRIFAGVHRNSPIFIFKTQTKVCKCVSSGMPPFMRNGGPLLLLLFDTMTITVQLPSAFIVEFYAQVISASEHQRNNQTTNQPSAYGSGFFRVFVVCFVCVFCLFNKTIRAKPRVDDRQTHIALPLQYCVNNSTHKSIFIVWPVGGSHSELSICLWSQFSAFNK